MPAIDLRGGRVVRLQQGDYARETDYALDPVALVGTYADAGAHWLHLVDLDGARAGAFANLRVTERIAATGRLRVQAGGGVRREDDVCRLLDAGVSRVVVGSMAVRAPDEVEKWTSRFGAERIVAALDTRFDNGVWRLPVAGWTQTSTATLDELALRYACAGLRHLLCTDIARDGMLAGPNLALCARMIEMAPSLALIASGGVRDAADLRALRYTGVAAAVVGRSLLEGCLTLREAFAC